MPSRIGTSGRLGRAADAAPLNPDAFCRELQRATREALASLRREAEGEEIDASGLYTEPLSASLVPTGNTTNALFRRSGGYLKNPLRWSPCDWAFHCCGEDHFDRAQALLDETSRTGWTGLRMS